MKAPASLLFLCLLLLLAGCSERDRPLDSPVRFEGGIFGSFYQVTIADSLTQGQARALEEGILEVLEAVDVSMSTYIDDSELSVFNQLPVGEWQPLSDELMEVLAIGQAVAQKSDGAFDVTVGGLVNLWSFGAEARPREVPDDVTLEARLAEVGFDAVELDLSALQARRTREVSVDLGGVAKGHATDRVAALLDRKGIEHYLVNLGGDLIARGHRNAGGGDDGEADPWRIGIEAPLEDRQEARHVLPLHDISVATSGDYRNYFEEDGRRFSHTLDPRSGRPITHRLASVSVLHPSNAWADAWATALMVLGDETGMALAREQGLSVLMIVREEEGGWTSLVSPAFVDAFGEALVADLGLEVH
ncbi:MAG: FAD:protein FMN transferase [Halomonas sp.]|uniref:FAD:protein FMN transferase n=1 Tax=Halomonas sp. TaxID=1486246 RepID=UPI0019EBFA4C|nr:FAD:protein FMN transferase [Halomonas sp.]MBE0490228.1 FAD:protein FMN transferase [Halomonas sp.]